MMMEVESQGEPKLSSAMVDEYLLQNGKLRPRVRVIYRFHSASTTPLRSPLSSPSSLPSSSSIFFYTYPWSAGIVLPGHRYSQSLLCSYLYPLNDLARLSTLKSLSP